MNNANLSRLTLRPATAEDEAFVLALEQANAPLLAASGRRVVRPGMGDEFPANCSLIQEDDEVVGSLMVSEELDVVQIDQFHILPNARGRGIGRAIMELLIARAEARSSKIRVSLFSANSSSAFFRKAGFETVFETTNRLTMERTSRSDTEVTNG